MLNSWRLMLTLLVVWPIGSWTQARNIPGELEVKAPQNMMDLRVLATFNHLKWLGYRIGWDERGGNLTIGNQMSQDQMSDSHWKDLESHKVWQMVPAKKGRDCQLTPPAKEAFRRRDVCQRSMIRCFLAPKLCTLSTCCHCYSAASWEFWFVVLEQQSRFQKCELANHVWVTLDVTKQQWRPAKCYQYVFTYFLVNSNRVKLK